MNGISSTGTMLVVFSTLVVMLLGAAVVFYFKKKTETAEDWAIGGRTLPWYVIVFTQFATLVGGGVLVGHVGIGYKFGLAPISYGICGAAGCFVMAIIAKWLRENEFTTIPDILEKVFGRNSFMMFVGAIMAMIVPFGWIASQMTAFAKLYHDITGLNTTVIIIAFALVCLLFTIPSGFKSVAWTDFLFGVIMLIMCWITGKLALDMGGGWANVVAKLPNKADIAFPGGLLAAGISTTMLWFIAATPGMMVNQMTLQRVCATDTVANARRTLIISGVLIAAMEIWVVIVGNVCRVLNPNTTGEMASGWFLTQLPMWAVALFAGFVATTIISTADSAIQSVSVNFTKDIYKGFLNKNADDVHLLKVSRISSLVISIISILIAVRLPGVLNMLIATYAYSASALLVPIYCGYAFRNKNFLTPAGGIASMLGGFAGCAAAQMKYIQIKSFPVPYAIYGIVVSFICLIVVSALTKKKA